MAPPSRPPLPQSSYMYLGTVERNDELDEPRRMFCVVEDQGGRAWRPSGADEPVLRPLVDARDKRPQALGNNEWERGKEGASGGKVERPTALLQVPASSV
jgi:hypothetical protein